MKNKILIDGIIGLDVTNQSVLEQLNKTNGGDVVAEIASPGGLVSEGLKIYNTLKNYEGRVDTHLMGAVASMATYIAMVGEKRTAEKNAIFMIHNGRTIAAGDHNTMFKVGSQLKALSGMIAREYSEKSNTPLADIQSAMDEETFYFGEEIVEAGFAHEVVGGADPGKKSEAVAMATMMIEECQGKITPESLQKDITAISTIMEVEAQPSAKPETHKEDNFMDYTMEGLTKDAPELLAEIRATAKAEGVEEGKREGVEIESARIIDLAKAHFEDDEEKFAAVVTSGVTVEQFQAIKSLQPKKEEDGGTKAAEMLEELKKANAEDPGQGDSEPESPKDFMAAAKAIKKAEDCTQAEAFSRAAQEFPELYAKHTGGK